MDKGYSGGLTDIEGIEVGHYSDKRARTGCTVMLLREGGVAGVDVRGAAPGTRETDLLRGYNLVERIHAILLSGGSAYGLTAAGGVMEYLENQKIGFDTGVALVPIVPAAVIYDLAVGDASVRPGVREGLLACEHAGKGPVARGAVGAGTGATVCKLYGAEYAQNGGVGNALVRLSDGVLVAALAVVNALGEIYDPETGARVLKSTGVSSSARPEFGNTTVGVVATNARLTREEATKFAGIAHDGLARTVRPAHTPFDGDTIFGVSTLALPPAPLTFIFEAAAEAMARAVIDAVAG